MKKIKLTQGECAMVDDEDFEWLNQFNWSVFKYKNTDTMYAKRNSPSTPRTVSMHREIMSNPKDMGVDHIDGNGLNNQRKNLRNCTSGENSRNRGKQINNTSGFKGVSWRKQKKRWRASISLNKKQIHLGYFSNKEEASKVYKKACDKYHGEFSNCG